MSIKREFDIEHDEVIRPGIEERMRNLAKGIVFTRDWRGEFWEHLSLLLQLDATVMTESGRVAYSYKISYKSPLLNRLRDYVKMLAKTAKQVDSGALPSFTSLMITLARHPEAEPFSQEESDAIILKLRQATDLLWADNELIDVENPETFYPTVPEEFCDEDDNTESDPEAATKWSLRQAERLYRARAKDFLPYKGRKGLICYPLRELKVNVEELKECVKTGARHLYLSRERFQLIRTVLCTETLLQYQVYQYATDNDGNILEDELERDTTFTPTAEHGDRKALLQSITSLLDTATDEKISQPAETRKLWLDAKVLFDNHQGNFFSRKERALNEFINLIKKALRQLKHYIELKPLVPRDPKLAAGSLAEQEVEECFRDKNAAVKFIQETCARVKKGVVGIRSVPAACHYILCAARKGDFLFSDCRFCREIKQNWDWSDATFEQYAKPTAKITGGTLKKKRERKAKRLAKKKMIGRELEEYLRNSGGRFS